MLTAIGMERALKQLNRRRPDRGHPHGEGGRRHLGAVAIPGIGEATFGNGLLDRHLAKAEVAAGEGMPAHEQQMEDQDREPKAS